MKNTPTLATLPPPPPGKTGWPWTEESPALPPTMAYGQPWPRVSVTTPSYNHQQFIEETIRSVLLQGYPNLEYMVIDGGSNDGSIEIIRKYEPWLAYWVSKPDGGQADAINKGWHRSTGDIIAYLNSDDTYVPGTMFTAVTALKNNPDAGMVFSDCQIIDEHSQVVDAMRGLEFKLSRQLRHNSVPQPTMFFRRQVFDKIGFLDASLQYTLDYEFCIRVGQHFNIKRVPGVLARYRMHQLAKSSSQMDRFFNEWVSIFEWAAQQDDLKSYMPHRASQRRGLAFFNLGIMYYAVGDMPQARSKFFQAAKLYPKLISQPAIWLYLIKSLLGARFMKTFRYWLNKTVRNHSLSQPQT